MENAQIGGIGEQNDPNKTNLINIFKEINTSAFLDNWGPAHVLQVFDPDTEVYGILVIDNLALGPGLGKIRISPNTTPYEVFQQARTMTLTCALANVKLGGAAACIKADPLNVDVNKVVKSFAKVISPFVPGHYIAAPETHVGQNEIAAFLDEIGDKRGATGKPECMGGIPHELGALGLGVAVSIITTINSGKFTPLLPDSISDTTIAIQGFDNVGKTVAKFLANKGAKIVAISDDAGAIVNPEGIDIEMVIKKLTSNGKNTLKNCADVKYIKTEKMIEVDCDVLILTKGKDQITEENVKDLNSNLIVEAENNTISFIAEQILNNKGIPVLPDVLTMAGCPICSYAEINRNDTETAFSLIETRIIEATKDIISQSIRSSLPLRRVATEIAKQRLLEAKEAAE